MTSGIDATPQGWWNWLPKPPCRHIWLDWQGILRSAPLHRKCKICGKLVTEP